MTENDDSRRLASIESVLAVTPIENADAIESVTVRGWNVVVKRGEFSVGDRVLYVEVDAALPLDDPRFAFLAERSEKEFEGRRVHVLKTARLRGIYSQGIVFGLDAFPEATQSAAPSDLDALLDITKWEPLLPAGMAALGPFPSWVRKTDAERVQNIDDATWSEIRGSASEWEAVEKIDGSSLTAWRTADGRLHVAGRNWELDPAHSNAHWKAAYGHGLASLLAPGEWVQGEVAGPEVQGNPLGLPDTRLFVFGFGRVASGFAPGPVSTWPAWAAALRPPVHDFDLPETISDAVEQVETLKSLVAPGRGAEGVVWTRASGEGLHGLDGRSAFKSISAKYLLKHDR